MNPNYRYPKEGAPTISGYTANNTVRLVLNDISLLQKIIDVATKSGANSINRLTFMLRDEQAVRAQSVGECGHSSAIGSGSACRVIEAEAGAPIAGRRRAARDCFACAPDQLRESAVDGSNSDFARRH